MSSLLILVMFTEYKATRTLDRPATKSGNVRGGEGRGSISA